MGAIREEMLMAMRMKNFSTNTIKSYMRHAESFVRMFWKSPLEMGSPEIKKYLEHLVNRNLSPSMIIIAYSALKFLYVETLHREWNGDFYRRPKREKRLPVVLSMDELKRLFSAVSNPKYRAVFLSCYSAGLRVGEATRLKVKDIDSQRMQIRVEQGKGKKDRYTILSQSLLTELRNYWKTYRPHDWLFPGHRSGKPICVCAVQCKFRLAKKKPVS